jgi:hypothetical protein
MFFYSDTEPRGSFNYGAISQMNATTQYCRHLGNWFYLKFILMNSKVFTEIAQANKELTICERKMKFWEKEEGFDPDLTQKENETLKKQWNMM